MNQTNQRCAPLLTGTCLTALVFLLCLSYGCRKTAAPPLPVIANDTLPPSGCPSRYYGVLASGPGDSILNLGLIDQQNGSSSPAGAFGTGSNYANHAVLADSIYYMFLPEKWRGGGSHPTGLRMKDLGQAGFTELNVGSLTSIGLAYNRTTHTFYGIRSGDHYNSGRSEWPDTLVSFTVQNGTVGNYSVLGIVDHQYVSPPVLAVDEQSNTLYLYVCHVPLGTRTLYAYNPVSGLKAIETKSGVPPLGLEFNPNDRMLYGVRVVLQGINATELLKIDPVSGNTTVLQRFPVMISSEFYSSAFDVCANRYLISGLNLLPQPAQGSLIICDLSSRRFLNFSGPTWYQGLVVRP